MRKGFTLIELSLVIVVIGLLAGGILGGRSLLRASELRGIDADMQRYVTATNTFINKYSALPGDFSNATSYWGVAHATAGTCKTTPSTTSATCNGDNNGIIDSSAASVEFFRYWQHLSNAGLIQGNYTGVGGSGGVNHASPGNNVPRGKLATSGYMPEYIGNQSSSVYYYDGSYGHQMRFGGDDTAGYVNTNLLTPEEMWSIDKKADDGYPAFGLYYVVKSSQMANCATSDTASSATYAITTSNKTCRAFYKTGF